MECFNNITHYSIIWNEQPVSKTYKYFKKETGFTTDKTNDSALTAYSRFRKYYSSYTVYTASSTVSFHKCYILNRQLKPLFATSITFCFIPSFLCSTARRLTKQFLGFVGSYCTQWDQHDACCACRLLLSLIEICCLHTSRRAPGHPFCFMTISVVLPWHQALWPRSLILSSLLKFQPLAGSFLYHSRTPKCCHSLLPGHLVLRVRGMNCDL